MKTIFYEIIFAPIVDILRKTTPQSNHVREIYNAGGNLTSLLVAIRTGRVQYQNGEFTGDFSVAISKDLRAIGATFDHRSSVYRMKVGDVPAFVRAEAAAYQLAAQAAHEEIRRRLNETQERIDEIMQKVHINADTVIESIDEGWRKSARSLTVQPKLTEESKKQLAEDYNKNLKLYIKDFSQQSITTLRETVEENAMDGFRFDSLTEKIRHRYGVTVNKARFLARQETGLYMSKFRKQRFEEAGVKRYRWNTSNDERVRDSHARLNKEIFFYDNPPITDRNTGARNNPGEDFNCRCVDEPILEHTETPMAARFS